MAETAGLVLGVFPLVIEGVKQYLEGVRTIKRWWKYASVLNHLLRILKREKAIFENTCDLLLCDLVPASVLNDLLQQPGGDLWKNDSLQAKLQHRLGRGFDTYLDAVTDMAEILDSFKAKLDLNENGKPRWVDYKTYKREWKRVRLILCEEENERDLKRIEKYNKDLQILLDQGLRLQSLKDFKASRACSNAKRYQHVREHARGVYNALKRSFSLPCGCQILHNASLQLEHRGSMLSPEVDNKEVDAKRLRFHIILHFELKSTNVQPLPWHWHETTIEPFALPNDSSTITTERPPIMASAQSFPNGSVVSGAAAAPEAPWTSHNSTSNLNAWLRKSSPSRPGRAPRRTVTFTVPNIKLGLDDPNQPSQKVPVRSVVKPERITLLCKALREMKKEACLGLLSDERQQEYCISVMKSMVFQESYGHVVSLDSLLSETRRLEKKDRLALGIKICSTLLQLHGTPWLRENWKKSDISFSDKQSHILARPLLTKNFLCGENSQPPEQLTSSHPSQEFPQVRNQILFTLGIALIELWFGKRLEDLRIAADKGINGEVNSITDFSAARRLCEEVYDEAGEWYGDAVRRCIYCEFDQRDNNLHTDSLKEAIHRGVIVPLEENLKSFCGGQLDNVLW
ncbi:MAG: hypothetical protein M1834_005034 [Cirrosporium novae-zelandiae]|nr:MAG: hypothetical protein M1834_005034 [Cirrosporium novae-zelandiae]